jgi:adenine-specific DNA methylase
LSNNTERKSLIEVWFPVKEVSGEAKKERPGRAPTFELHYWWTRKPLIVSRAVVLGSLLPSNFDKTEFLRLLGNPPNSETRAYNFNVSTQDLKLLSEFYHDAWQTYEPSLLDTMAGGGSIPFEADRVGCRGVAIEYNPVAYIILKATLEYPQRYKKRLARDVEKWAKWVISEAEREIGKLYPSHRQNKVSHYLWYRIIDCPRCKLRIPLADHWWLSTKQKLVLQYNIHREASDVELKIRNIQTSKGVDPDAGTIKASTVQCPRCKAVIKASELRQAGKVNKIGHRLAIVIMPTERRGKLYESATEEDFRAVSAAEKMLKEQWNDYQNQDLIPTEIIHVGKYIRSKDPSYESLRPTWGQSSYLRPPSYGMDSWYKLFNPRQLLTHIVLLQCIRKARNKIYEESTSRMGDSEAREYAKAIMTYLAISFDKLVNFNSVSTIWSKDRETVAHSFSYRGLNVVWNYVEVNPFAETGSGTWQSCLKTVIDSITFSSEKSRNPSKVLYGSATRLPFDESSMDVMIVDPPYYADVPYGELSDFWYVWMRRALRDDFSEVFSTKSTPKDEEVDYSAGRFGSEETARAVYESLLRKSFEEIKRVLRDDGLAVIVFAHASTQAWEGVINALIDAGLYATATWPVKTETEAGVLRNRASIISSICIVVRKRHGEASAWFEEIKSELRNRIWARLDDFYDKYKLTGADLFVAAIGPAIEVFGKYSSIKSYTGETVPISKVLDEMRATVAEYVFEKLANEPGIASKVDAATRFYVVARWVYTFKGKDGKLRTQMPFDEARKLAISLGTSVDSFEDTYKILEKQKGKKEGGNVRVLNVLDREHEQKIDLRKPKANCVIDALHLGILAYQSGGREAMDRLLSTLGLKGAPEIRAVAQALLQALPDHEEESKLIAQFMLGLPSERASKGPLDKFLSRDKEGA